MSTLYDVIDNNTDQQRWDAIQALTKDQTLKDVCKHTKITYGSLRVWISNNKHKYEQNVYKPSQSHRLPVEKQALATDSDEFVDPTNLSDDQINLLEYGKIKPTLYVSTLSHMEWGQHYLGHSWSAPYLEKMSDEIWNRQTLIFQTGRYHGKTWTMIKLFTRYLLEERKQILCMSNKAKREDIWLGVRDSLRRPEIRRQYGDVMASARGGNSTDITFTQKFRYYTNGANMDGPNFKVVTAGPQTTQVGLHPHEGWLHLEDPVQDMMVSDEAEQRVKHWYDRTVKYIAGRNTKKTATGTRKDPTDFYHHLEENHYWPKLVQEAFVINSGRLPNLNEISVNHEYAIVTDWPHAVGTYSILGCPEYPLERLLYEFIFHPDAAEAELNNNPLPRSGNYFNIDQWVEDELPEKWHLSPKYIVVDPAFGGSSTSSKTAIIVLMIHQGRMWIIDMYVGRASLTQKQEYIVHYAKHYNPKQILIEDNFGQISTRYEQKSQLMQLRGLYLYEAANDKKERIGALDFPYLKHEIVVYINCAMKQELKTEFLKFSMEDSPTVIRQQYNALDALSSGYERLKHYLGGTSGWYSRTWNSKR